MGRWLKGENGKGVKGRKIEWGFNARSNSDSKRNVHYLSWTKMWEGEKKLNTRRENYTKS